MKLKEIVTQLRSCGYQCVAGRLENNVAFRELELLANAPAVQKESGEEGKGLPHDRDCECDICVFPPLKASGIKETDVSAGDPPKQNELSMLLDEFDAEVNSATKNEHWLALALLVTPLVKALRRAVEIINSLNEQGDYTSDIAKLLREPADSVSDGSSSTASGASSEERQERCVRCNKFTSDWVDTEYTHGRVCRPCEAIIEVERNAPSSPSPEAITDTQAKALEEKEA